jgi:uncharacterized protein
VITRGWIVGLAGLCVVWSAGVAQAQFDRGGIMVSGIGTVKGMPDKAKIEIRMQGKAEITDDALVKYHASHQRLTEALEKLKLENLHVSERGVAMSTGSAANMQMMMWNGMGNQTETAGSTEISGMLRVELTGLAAMPKEEIWKTLGKVLDAIRDAGGSIGMSASDSMAMRYWGRMPQNQGVRFVMSDLKPLREQAYEQAVADARTRGDRLAKLSGIKLGRVAAVSENQVPGDGPRNPYAFYGFDEGAEQGHDRDEIVVSSLTEIPVTVHLSVRFDIVDSGDKASEVSTTGVVDPKTSTQ